MKCLPDSDLCKTARFEVVGLVWFGFFANLPFLPLFFLECTVFCTKLCCASRAMLHKIWDEWNMSSLRWVPSVLGKRSEIQKKSRELPPDSLDSTHVGLLCYSAFESPRVAFGLQASPTRTTKKAKGPKQNACHSSRRVLLQSVIKELMLRRLFSFQLT